MEQGLANLFGNPTLPHLGHHEFVKNAKQKHLVNVEPLLRAQKKWSGEAITWLSEQSASLCQSKNLSAQL